MEQMEERLKNERNQNKGQIKELEIKLKLQEEYIEKLENGTVKGSENKKGLLKSLIN